MSIPQSPKPAKLIVGVIMREKGLCHSIMGELIARFGPMDLISPWFSFDFTPYYEPEMGSPLFRRMTAYQNLIQQKDLPNIKITTNAIESQYTENTRRMINIDPGYVTHERLVLATGKNFTHRVYLDKGIYADLTMVYQKGAFHVLPWTYPDYRENNMLNFITRVRSKYVRDFKYTQHPCPALSGIVERTL